MGLQGILDWIWMINHDDENSAWGSWTEIVFWVAVLAVHLGLVVFAAWNLAVKHTEATGSSVLVEVEPEKESCSASGDSNLLGGTSRRKNRGILSRFTRSSD